MTSLRNIGLWALLLLVLAPSAKAQDATAQFRYMSLVIRDKAPSVAEAKAFAAAEDKDAKLADYIATWMNSAAFDARLRRHFHDMFGIEPYTFVAEPVFDLHRLGEETAAEAPPDLVESGVYYLKSSIKPTCGDPVDATAWWTTGNIRICETAVSAGLTQAGNWCADPFSANGIRHANCGCGPDQVICWPQSARGKLQVGVVKEFAERGLYAYDNSKSWEDLFGGDTFVGNKWLYHHYVYQQRIQVSALPPTAAQLALMRSLPDNGVSEAAFPAGGGPERSGVVTMPSFMRRYNNFRSRIRAITEQLLCQDIDSSLNTDDIDHFVNDDLTDFDKAHGDQASCSNCHYAMDNMGSTLLGWGDGGVFEAWWPRSQTGHVFGQTGEGPRFLMKQYVERGDPFTQCMARKTWEGFSGATWSVLTAAQKAQIEAAAAQGPRQVIETVLTSGALRGLRGKDDTVVKKTVTVTYDFEDDVNPILQASCGTAGCHAAGGAGGQFVGNEAGFKGADAARIQNGSMPPAGSGMSLSDADRDTLLLFLGQ